MSSSIESLSFNGESSKAGENRSQDDVDRREGANEQSNNQGDVDGGGGAGDNDNVDDDDAPTALTPTTRAALPVDDAIARIEASSTPQKDLHRRLFEDFVRSKHDELVSRKVVDDARFDRLVQLLTDKQVEAAATPIERFQAKSFQFELVEGGATRDDDVDDKMQLDVVVPVAAADVAALAAADNDDDDDGDGDAMPLDDVDPDAVAAARQRQLLERLLDSYTGRKRKAPTPTAIARSLHGVADCECIHF